MMKLLLSSLLIGLVAAGQALAGIPAYYRFEEGSGTTVLNSATGVSNGAHGAAYSSDVPISPIPQTGAGNGFSLAFNNIASANYTGPDFILHAGYGAATLEFWIKAPDQPHSSIFWTRPDTVDSNRFNISINPGGALNVDYRDPSAGLHELLSGSTFVITPDTWTHIAITRQIDSASQHTYDFYRNGSLVATAIDSNPDLPTANGWTISGRTVAGFQMDGLIDEVRFSDTALSPSGFLNAAAPIPEPRTIVLMGCGLLLLLARYRLRVAPSRTSA
jgi:hypothetical protein